MDNYMLNRHDDNEGAGLFDNIWAEEENEDWIIVCAMLNLSNTVNHLPFAE